MNRCRGVLVSPFFLLAVSCATSSAGSLDAGPVDTGPPPSTSDAAVLVDAGDAPDPYVTDAPVDIELAAPPGAAFEIPPFVLGGEARSLTASTGFTYQCWTFDNPLLTRIALPSNQCARISDPFTQDAAMTGDWRLSYNGIYTQHVIQVGASQRLIALIHGENKNECLGGKTAACGSRAGCLGTCSQGTVPPSVSCASCASGIDACNTYGDCWDSYSAFISVSSIDYSAASLYGQLAREESGPILWPANGYSVNNVKSSHGVRHPHGLTSGDYVYVFYVDQSFGATVNRGTGIRVARAPISGGALPGTWQTYCDGGWVDSLPAGFSLASLSLFFDKQGGCASPILPDEGQSFSFAAAHVKRGGYVGVLEASANDRWVVRLLSSPDLVHWSEVTELRAARGDWAMGDLHYPVFVSQDGWSSEVVDDDAFYVWGTRYDGATPLRAIKIHR